MIDWVTAELPCHHIPLNSGAVMKVSGDGSLEWQTPCRLQVQGSHESSIQVRSGGHLDSQGRATSLFFSGNPSKFLQGHNVFGSDDLRSLMLDTFFALCSTLKIDPLLVDISAIEEGDYPLITVDINQAFELPRRQDVLSWLRAAEFKSKTRHGRPQMKGGTIYWGKHSARWALKGYSKGEEIEAPKHKLPEALNDTPLKKWADNKLRLELRLKKKELAGLGIVKANQLTEEKVKTLYRSYVRKIEMKEQIRLTSENEMKLPQKLRSTYVLWKAGEDLRSTLPKATFYRHRKELSGYGIDITLRQDTAERNNVIPLVRVLEAKPASIPDWAFTQKLVHHSARA